jgi:hypothetical protein
VRQFGKNMKWTQIFDTVHTGQGLVHSQPDLEPRPFLFEKNFATKVSPETMADKDYEIDIEGTGHDEEMEIDNEPSTVTRRGRGFRGRNDDAHFTARNNKTDRLAGTPGPATAVRCTTRLLHLKLPYPCLGRN